MGKSCFSCHNIKSRPPESYTQLISPSFYSCEINQHETLFLLAFIHKKDGVIKSASTCKTVLKTESRSLPCCSVTPTYKYHIFFCYNRYFDSVVVVGQQLYLVKTRKQDFPISCLSPCGIRLSQSSKVQSSLL